VLVKLEHAFGEKVEVAVWISTEVDRFPRLEAAFGHPHPCSLQARQDERFGLLQKRCAPFRHRGYSVSYRVVVGPVHERCGGAFRILDIALGPSDLVALRVAYLLAHPSKVSLGI
jgi:hypothetical protein